MTRSLLLAALLALLSSPAAHAQYWLSRDIGNNTPSRYVADFDMPSVNVIWGVNYDGSGVGAPVQEVFVSANGGATWSSNVVITANSAAKTLTNISAIDASTAYVGGFDADNGGGWLFKTTDGGTNFTEVTIPTMTYLNIVHFFDASTGLLIGDPTGTSTYWEVFRTTDGGATWNRVPQSMIPAAIVNDYGFTHQYDAVGDNIWFTSNRGSIYHSPDRGVTWFRHATGFTSTGNLAAINEVEFSDALNGLLVGRTGMSRTTDGGATWTPLTPAGPVYNDYLSSIPGLPNAYVGVSANVTTGIGASVTYDAGQTWILLDSAQNQYTDVIFFDNQHGWTGGFTGLGGTGGVFEYVGTPLATAPEVVREPAAVYPNPTAGLLRLAGADPRETVTVYDLTGRALRRCPVPATGALNLADLPAGLYQLVFTGRPTPRAARVAIER